jgi:hypothetical protein
VLYFYLIIEVGLIQIAENGTKIEHISDGGTQSFGSSTTTNQKYSLSHLGLPAIVLVEKTQAVWNLILKDFVKQNCHRAAKYLFRGIDQQVAEPHQNQAAADSYRVGQASIGKEADLELGHRTAPNPPVLLHEDSLE